MCYTVISGVFYGLGFYGVPPRNGKLKDLSKFDASFFGVPGKIANVTDPQMKLLLESTYEALFDAGAQVLLMMLTSVRITLIWICKVLQLKKEKRNF